MAIIKPLNLANGEQLNANRASKNAAINENDGQTFMFTLRQQMQQTPETKADINDDASINVATISETQSGLLASQTESAIMAAQSHQDNPLWKGISSTVDIAPKPAQLLKNEGLETPQLREVVSIISNKKSSDMASSLMQEPAISADMQMANGLKTIKDPIASLQMPTQIDDYGNKKGGIKQEEVNKDTIANIGWVASMMAMRENQVMPNRVTINTENTSIPTSPTVNKTPTQQLGQADVLIGQATLNQSLPNSPLEQVSSTQNDKTRRFEQRSNEQALVFSTKLNSRIGFEEQAFTSFVIKENAWADSAQINPPLQSQMQPLMSQASTQDGQQSVISTTNQSQVAIKSLILKENAWADSAQINPPLQSQMQPLMSQASTQDSQQSVISTVNQSEVAIKPFVLKENGFSNAAPINQMIETDNQSVGISKAFEQPDLSLESKAKANLQNSVNSQVVATLYPAASYAPVSQESASVLQPIITQVNVPFGIKGWQEAMNNQVMQMTQQGNEEATLTLSPPDLGPVQVVLRVDNQSVDTAFISDNAIVRQALEDGLQDLKERMASQGLQLGNTFVGNGNQAQQHFEHQNRPAPQPLTQLSLPPNSESVSSSVRSKPQGLVDTFV